MAAPEHLYHLASLLLNWTRWSSSVVSSQVWLGTRTFRDKKKGLGTAWALPRLQWNIRHLNKLTITGVDAHLLS